MEGAPIKVAVSGGPLIRGRSIVSMRPCALFRDLALLSVVIIGARCTEAGQKLVDGATALYKTVDFMAQRPHQLNIDAVYGLALTEANLKKALSHGGLDHLDDELVTLLRKTLEVTRRASKNASMLLDPKSKKINDALNEPRIWTRPIRWTYLPLGSRLTHPENITRESVTNFLYQGTPNEVESDRCIQELVDDSVKSHCQVSDYCANVLLKDDQPRGYPLTHRLLYIQIANALGCARHESTPFRRMVPKYCSAILQDAVELEATGFPSVSRDLLTEQVILCGMEGYLEFTDDHYADLIVSWASPLGCYNAFGMGNGHSRRRMKRESQLMDFGCDNHATSLAAASLSLLIRRNIESNHRIEDDTKGE